MAETKEVCEETAYKYINQMEEALSNGCGTYSKPASYQEECALTDDFECAYHKTTHEITVVYIKMFTMAVQHGHI